MTFDLNRIPTPTSTAGRLALSTVLVGGSFALTLAVQQITGRGYLIIFIPAVMIAAWVGGRMAGLAASLLTVVLSATLLLPENGLVDGLIWLAVAAVVTAGTSSLTTWRRLAEERLIALAAEERSRRRDAETLSQHKTDLLAQVAHELRQPLGAIAMATRLLADTNTSAARSRALGVLDRQTQHLRHLVDDLLDLSRIARHDVLLRKADVDLCQLVDDVRHAFAMDLAERNITFSVSVPPCPVILDADPTRVRQILSNLVSNAVKFTPEGGRVEVSVAQNKADVVIRVRDTGRGIPPDRLPHIFEMFQKGDGGSGLGVGLAVVRGLAEVHGGSVQARSEGPGRGSEFIVTLPARIDRAA